MTTRSISRFAPILLLTAGLAACDQTPVAEAPPQPSPAETAGEPSGAANMPEAPVPYDPAPPAPRPPAQSSPQPTPQPAPLPPPPAPERARWEVSRTRDGAVATLAAPSGVLLRISCLADTRRLRVHVPGLRPVASEDRLSIGLGGDPIALAANLDGRGRGVTAQGPLPANISARILRGRAIQVNYGRQNAGPFEILRGQDAMTLANACAEAASPAPQQPPRPDEPGGERAQIPANFRGEWNSRLQDCGTSRNESRLAIEARNVRFYESRAEVTGVTRQNARSITVDARYRGEGETWNRSTRMTLSRDGDQLTIDGITRQRCPTAAQPPRRPAR